MRCTLVDLPAGGDFFNADTPCENRIARITVVDDQILTRLQFIFRKDNLVLVFVIKTPISLRGGSNDAKCPVLYVLGNGGGAIIIIIDLITI